GRPGSSCPFVHSEGIGQAVIFWFPVCPGGFQRKGSFLFVYRGWAAWFPRAQTSNVLSKSKQIVIGVEQGKFLLSPGLCLQGPVWMNFRFVGKQGFIQDFSSVGPYIDLSIIFIGIQALEFKEMDFNLTPLYH